jgi:predicted PurR-regulated permease PerM
MASDTRQDALNVLSSPLNIIAAGVILTGLVYGADFLIPIVVAFLIANVLEALIQRLQRLRLPLLIAMPLAILIVLAAITGLVVVFMSQIDEFAAAWPRYTERLEALGVSLVAGLGEEWTAHLQKQLSSLDLAGRLSSAVGSASNLLINFLLVLLYVAFLLAERGRMYRRLVSLGDTSADRSQTLRTLDNISDGIRQYLYVKTVVSLVTGGISYAVLTWIGLDFAEIWAVIIFLLNFIPSIGSVLGVVFPALLALVQFDTLEPFLIIVGFLAVIQVLIGNVAEPALMGRSLNLSPFAVMASLMFWSAVWGIAGAFLAVPITAALLILCRELDAWRWISVLLSNDDGRHTPSPT